jgi:ABC-type Mn2+/Zn2+ transport system permease subunit
LNSRSAQQAALACVLLALVLAPLGTEVIRRRIVFVDLALAQIAALGAAIGTAVDWDPIATSVVFTLIGAALLSVPAASTRLPQEAVMGMVYAVASAAAVLVVARPRTAMPTFCTCCSAISRCDQPAAGGLAGPAIGVGCWRGADATHGSDHDQPQRHVSCFICCSVDRSRRRSERGCVDGLTYLVAPALAVRLLAIERGAAAVAVISAAGCGVLGLWGSVPLGPAVRSSIVATFGLWLAVTAVGTMRRRQSRL